MNSRIKTIRKHFGKTQVEFASELGVSPSNIIAYENGKRYPSEAMAQLICNKYGISESWLRTGSGEMLAPLDRSQEIAEIAATIFKSKETDMRFQLQKLIAQLPESDIEVLVDIATKIAEAKEKTLR